MKKQPVSLFAMLVFVLCVAIGPLRVHAAMTTGGDMIVVAEYVEAEQIIAGGNFEAAIPLLNEAIRKFPTHASAWNLLGFANRRLGRFDEAEKFYEAALTINPNHTGALNYMGQLFLQTGRPDKAKEMLTRLEAACVDGCRDLDHLKEAVATGVAGNY